MLPVTTARILAEKALQETCGRQCVDWAIGMLELGRDSPNLLQLAGMLPPYNHFELAALRDRALQELKIQEAPPSDAIREYAVEVLRCALNGDLEVIEALDILVYLCRADGFRKDLMQFYHLSYGQVDLQDGGMQWCLDGATVEDFDEIFRVFAKEFVQSSSTENNTKR